MKRITIGTDQPGYYKDTEHSVITVDGEGVLLVFVRQFDDFLINTPNGDLLLSWDVDHEITDFDESNCMFLSAKDNLKELGNLKAQLMAIRTFDKSESFKVYITTQRN